MKLKQSYPVVVKRALIPSLSEKCFQDEWDSIIASYIHQAAKIVLVVYITKHKSLWNKNSFLGKGRETQPLSGWLGALKKRSESLAMYFKANDKKGAKKLKSIANPRICFSSIHQQESEGGS